MDAKLIVFVKTKGVDGVVVATVGLVVEHVYVPFDSEQPVKVFLLVAQSLLLPYLSWHARHNAAASPMTPAVMFGVYCSVPFKSDDGVAAARVAAAMNTADWVGAEYTPWRAGNELWWARYTKHRPDVVREVAAMSDVLGYTTLRVFLHDLLWFGNSTALLANMDDFLGILDQHHMRAGFVFFDDDWSKTGANLSTGCWANNTPTQGVHNGCWVAGPQQPDRDARGVAGFQPYVAGVVKRFRADKRVAFFELINEPHRNDPWPFTLRDAAFDWARALWPLAPVISGWDDNNATEVVDTHEYSIPNSRSPVFSNASKGGVVTEAGCRWYQGNHNTGSPLSWLYWLTAIRANTTSQFQAPFVPGVMLSWEVMVGNTMTRWHWATPVGAPEPAIPWCGMLYPDGSPVSYTEAAALRLYSRGQDDFLFRGSWLNQSAAAAGQLCDSGNGCFLGVNSTSPWAGWNGNGNQGASESPLYELTVWPDAVSGSLQVTVGGYTVTIDAVPQAWKCAVKAKSTVSGCYLDQMRWRILPVAVSGGFDGMSQEVCAAMCRTANFTTVGDVSGVENANECWCGALAKSAVKYNASTARRHCDSPCPGEPSEMCGGSYAMSIFEATCKPQPETAVKLVLAATAGSGKQLATKDVKGMMVEGAWNLLRVLVEGKRLRLWLNPNFADITGGSAPPADEIRPPATAVPLIDLALAQPSRAGQRAKAEVVGRSKWRIDYVSVLPPTLHPKRKATMKSDDGHDASTDWRNASNGRRVYPAKSTHNITYQDQPQISVLQDGLWFVVWTHGCGKSEGARNIVLSSKSSDQGISWSKPVNVEPLAVDAASSASWANPLVVGSRLYVFYTYQCWHAGPGGNPGVKVNVTKNGAGRNSNLQGCWFFKTSDDGGKTFSSTRTNYTAAVADGFRFALDSTNPFQTGTCKAGSPCPRGVLEGWSTGKPLLASNGDLFMQFSKIGGPSNSITQGLFLRSSNIHRVGIAPKDITFEVLPKRGSQGLRAICADDGAPFDVLQEGNILEIDAAKGSYYALGRTNCGYLTAFSSLDSGDSWSAPGYAEYDKEAAVAQKLIGRGLKQPIGPLCPRRIELSLPGEADSRFLLLYYNNGFPKLSDSKSREVYWISAGRAVNATIVWSQPEIGFYEFDQSAGDPSHMSYKSVDYPDFVQQGEDIFVALTNKDVISVRKLPSQFWKTLLRQNELSAVVRDASLALEHNTSTRTFAAPNSALGVDVAASNSSFTIELSVAPSFVPSAPAANDSSWKLLARDKAPKDTTSSGSCVNGLNLASCAELCGSQGDCHSFWLYDSGRCCPKSAFSMAGGWQNFSAGGGWYSFSGHTLPPPSEALLDCRTTTLAQGVALFAPAANGSGPRQAQPMLSLSSEYYAINSSQLAQADFEDWNTDDKSSGNTIAFVVDGAAQIISTVLNGVLSDGGLRRQQGWARLSQQLRSLRGGSECRIGGSVRSVRVYSRALMTSELVGSWRAQVQADE